MLNRLATGLFIFLVTASSAMAQLPEKAEIMAIDQRQVVYLKGYETKLSLAGILFLDAVTVENIPVTIEYLADKPNRHGAYPAILYPEGSAISLQEEILQQGLAVFYPLTSHDINKKLQEAESYARKRGKGLWSSEFTVLDAVELEKNYSDYLNKFVIVRGIATATGGANSFSYINFGDDWRNDFTIGMENRVARNAGFDIGELVGRTVTVRGWLREYYGPFVEIFSMEEISYK